MGYHYGRKTLHELSMEGDPKAMRKLEVVGLCCTIFFAVLFLVVVYAAARIIFFDGLGY